MLNKYTNNLENKLTSSLLQSPSLEISTQDLPEVYLTYALKCMYVCEHMNSHTQMSMGHTCGVPVLFGVENPKPWDATLPPPELKVPAGFCSPKDELLNAPNVLAPLFPNRLEVSKGTKNRCEGG